MLLTSLQCSTLLYSVDLKKQNIFLFVADPAAEGCSQRTQSMYASTMQHKLGIIPTQDQLLC